MELTAKDKAALLDIVKKTIASKVNNKVLPKTEADSDILKEKRGAFVTLKKRGHLRGCIGYIKAVKPLWETVQEMAVAAAFHDPRFPSLKPDELKDLSFEVSVLSPLRRINDINEIEVGKHGLYIVRGYNSGLLLPQVAVEYGWDRENFLAETCYKAGLPPQASVVNLARGGHVVDADLLAALHSGRLRHAVLDVFHTEPLPAGHAFWRHPKVTLLPHAAALTDPRSATVIAAANLRAARDGLPLSNLVDRAKGY